MATLRQILVISANDDAEYTAVRESLDRDGATATNPIEGLTRSDDAQNRTITLTSTLPDRTDWATS
jgi:hypothetical protein